MCTLESWFTAKPIFVSARSLVDNSPMSRSSCVDVWLLFERNNITSHYLWALDQMHRISDKNRRRSTVGRVHYLHPINIFHETKNNFQCARPATPPSVVPQKSLQLPRSLCSVAHARPANPWWTMAIRYFFWTNYKRTGKRQNLCIFL